MINAINSYNPNFNAKIKPNKVRKVVDMTNSQLKGVTKSPIRMKDLEKYGEYFAEGCLGVTLVAPFFWARNGSRTEDLSSFADIASS